jgi:hypothetical protein
MVDELMAMDIVDDYDSDVENEVQVDLDNEHYV